MGSFGGSVGVADEEMDVESAEMAAPEEEAVSARSVVAERRMLRRREERSQHAAFAKLATEDKEMEIAVPTSNTSPSTLRLTQRKETVQVGEIEF